MITGRTKVYGLIGNPVAQSFSPFIHNTLAQAMGIDMTYVTFPVEKGRLEDAYAGMKALGIGGMNVTVPYKSDIIPGLDYIDKEAESIGAVNTLVYEGEGIKGYNTDWIGLLTSLKRNGIGLGSKKILIIGAGGSARAVAVMCAKEGADKVTVANRTIEKAEIIVGLLKKNYQVVAEAISVTEAEGLGGFDVVFQTTPLGMYPKPEASPIQDSTFLETAEAAVDLIYNPAETMFLSQAKERGCKILNGKEMLFFQGLKAFELWNDINVPEAVSEACLEAFSEAIKNK